LVILKTQLLDKYPPVIFWGKYDSIAHAKTIIDAKSKNNTEDISFHTLLIDIPAAFMPKISLFPNFISH